MPIAVSTTVPRQLVLPLTDEMQARMQKHLDAQKEGGTRALYRRILAAGLDALEAAEDAKK